MRRYFLFIFLLIHSGAFCQNKCLQFTFDITKDSTDIHVFSHRRHELDSLSINVKFHNCGTGKFVAPQQCKIENGYDNAEVYKHLGISTFYIRVYKLDPVYRTQKSFFPYELHRYEKGQIEKSNYKTIVVPPDSSISINNYYWTDYFKHLPPGDYVVALDYVYEIIRPFKIGKIRDKDILKKYRINGNNASGGAFLQFSENTIGIKVAN